MKAAQTLLDEARGAGHGPRDPLLVTSDKTAPSKAAMVKSFRRVALAAGYEEAQVNAITGHTLRPSGAQYMARLGVECYKIQLFCRWGSDTVLKYLREVPMEDSHQWMNQASSASLEEITLQAAANLDPGSEQVVAKEDIEKIVIEALGADVMSLAREAVESASMVKEILLDVKQRSVEMNEHWAHELARRFLPKYLINRTSHKLHVVKDAHATYCGFEYRLARDVDFTNVLKGNIPKCEAPGCSKRLESTT